MTRKQMISTLRGMDFGSTIGTKGDEALRMAISALEQEPCDDAEQIDYHDDFETASRKIHDYEERQKQNDKKCGSYNNTNTFKSCCDCKLIGTDSCYMSCGGSKSLYKPKQKSEPCTDAVSREAVMNLLDKERDEYTIQKVKALPSVQPSQKEQEPKYWIDYYGHVTPLVQPSRKGHWIDALYSRKCSECGYDMCKKDEWGQFIPDKACPNCGCRMVEPQESEDKE